MKHNKKKHKKRNKTKYSSIVIGIHFTLKYQEPPFC